jgi:hypothetical protein
MIPGACCRPLITKQDEPCMPGKRTLLQRCLDALRWMAPGFVLLIIPKCPICLAAYVALGTGIGISFAVAAWIRWILIALCVVSLLYLIGKRYLRNS